jgi:hypothetical protein
MLKSENIKVINQLDLLLLSFQIENGLSSPICNTTTYYNGISGACSTDGPWKLPIKLVVGKSDCFRKKKN